jgi:hypothetical protein
MTSYAVGIERASDGGYGAWCPDLPGCVALAETRDRGRGPGRDAAGHQVAPGRAPRRRPANPPSLNRGGNRYHSRRSLTRCIRPGAKVIRSSVSRAPLETTWGPHGIRAAEQPAGGRPGVRQAEGL